MVDRQEGEERCVTCAIRYAPYATCVSCAYCATCANYALFEVGDVCVETTVVVDTLGPARPGTHGLCVILRCQWKKRSSYTPTYGEVILHIQH